jgi:hypothetical protein
VVRFADTMKDRLAAKEMAVSSPRHPLWLVIGSACGMGIVFVAIRLLRKPQAAG